MKKYRLLKDLPGFKAGTILRYLPKMVEGTAITLVTDMGIMTTDEDEHPMEVVDDYSIMMCRRSGKFDEWFKEEQ